MGSAPSRSCSSSPSSAFLELRPDGAHFTGQTATVIAEWLAPELADGWREIVVEWMQATK